MKTCPFCAEEIKEAAIKCKHCGSMVDRAPGAAASAAGPAAPRLEPAASGENAVKGDERRRVILYTGYPSWRAFLGAYALIVAGGILFPILGQAIARWRDAAVLTIVLTIAIPLLAAVAAFFIVGIYRKSRVVRITSTNIETERGIVSKRIDVLELWRCRDIQYKQSLFDRILGIAHIVIFAKDETTPHLEVVGLPASRQLFEKIRDSFEIQRHSKNVRRYVE